MSFTWKYFMHHDNDIHQFTGTRGVQNEMNTQGVYRFREIKFMTFFRPFYDQFVTIRGVF